jgi:hypothetical protein
MTKPLVLIALILAALALTTEAASAMAIFH